MAKGSIIGIVALMTVATFIGGYFLADFVPNSQDAMLMIGEENRQWVEAAIASYSSSGGLMDFTPTTIGWINVRFAAAKLEATCLLPHTLGDKSLFIDGMRVYLDYHDGGDRIDHIVFYVDGVNTHQDMSDRTTAGRYYEYNWTAEDISTAYAAIAEVGVVADGTLDIVIGSIQFRCYYA